jgi:plasmid maintenance system killer protein
MRDLVFLPTWKACHAIRINHQWRIIFRWVGHACDVAIVDDH